MATNRRRRFTTYLAHLRFDQRLDNSVLAKYLTNPRLVLLLITLLVLIGVGSLANIPRVLNPDVNIPYVVITTSLPGAGPKDVESLVTIPIEDSVTGVQNVKTVTSSSLDNLSVVEVEFNTGIDPDKARQDVQSAVDSVSGLPSDAQTPKVEKVDFQHIPVWTFAVTSNQGDQASLHSFAQTLQENLKNVSSIESVTTSGLDDQEVQVLLTPQSLADYHLSPFQLGQVIAAGVKSFPAGSVHSTNDSYALTIDPAITTVDDIRSLPLSLNGSTIPLSEIATVAEKAKPDQPQSFLADSMHPASRAVTFSLFKTSAVSIDQAVKDAEKSVNDSLSSTNNQFTVHTILNTSQQIDKQFSDLYRDFSLTILLVFLTLFIFLGIRQAVVALFATPLTFFITFTVMNLTHIPLSFIAIFSLLLSLGLLVDDTIVVISAMTAYFRTGKFSPVQTGLLVWRDFITAIFTTTITTVWAFLPLLLAGGIIGEFIKAIPIVVTATLIGSFFVAMAITLPILVLIFSWNLPRRVVIFCKALLLLILVIILLVILPKGPLFPLELLAVLLFLLVTRTARVAIAERATMIKPTARPRRRGRPPVRSQIVQAAPVASPLTLFLRKYTQNGLIHFEKIAIRYRGWMRTILLSAVIRKRVISMVILFSVFSYLLLPLGFVRNEFFPNSDQDSLSMSLELPSGTNLATTTAEGLRLLNQLRKTPDVAFVTADIGQGGNSGTGFGGGSSGNNQVAFSLAMLPVGERHRGSIEVAQALRQQYAAYSKGTLSVVEASSGPPAGADVQIKLFGDDLTQLDSYATTVKNYLKSQPGITNVDTSSKPGTSKLVFVPDQTKLATSGLTLDTVGQWLRFFASGYKAASVKFAGENNEDRDITIRMNPSMPSATAIDTLSIPAPAINPAGQPIAPVPLSNLGSLELAANPTLISRESGKRTISVTASVTKDYSVSLANQNLENFANTKLNLAPGYSWQTGGVNEENQSSVTSIIEAMFLSFLLIIITMVIQFSSFRKALIVMLVIPLSISGVFILFALTHTPLSFPALIGVLALFGIVVKNAILVVDKINQNTRAGMEFIDSIVDGASSRLEAIALTSFATIVGLIPITLSDPLWRGLGGAIIAGLAFSGTIMLFFIPIVYYYWFRPSPVVKRRGPRIR